MATTCHNDTNLASYEKSRDEEEDRDRIMIARHSAIFSAVISKIFRLIELCRRRVSANDTEALKTRQISKLHCVLLNTRCSTEHDLGFDF